jgi:hypothetical protein
MASNKGFPGYRQPTRRDMRYTTDRAIIESRLAVAHKAIHTAMQAADREDDNVLYLDLMSIEVTLVRLAERSLRGKARTQMRGQLELVD